MDVLLTDLTTPEGLVGAHSLRAAGHRVHGCHADETSTVDCVATVVGGCPLDRARIDVVVSTRPSCRVVTDEGLLCAARRQLPVVRRSGDGRWVSPVAPMGGDELAPLVEFVAGSPLPDHSEVATQAMRTTLGRLGVDAGHAYVVVRRRAGGLTAELADLDCSSDAEGAAVRAVLRALRAMDHWAGSIDIFAPRPV